MSVEGSTITSRIKNLLRSPSIKLRRSKPGSKREDISSKVSFGCGQCRFCCLVLVGYFSEKSGLGGELQMYQDDDDCPLFFPKLERPGCYWGKEVQKGCFV